VRVLFFMRAVNYDRLFEGLLRELLERGHEVHAAFDVAKRGRKGDSALLDGLGAEYPGFTTGLVPPRRHPEWADLATDLRHSLDWLRFLEPGYENATGLRARAEHRAPLAVRRIAHSRGAAPGAPPRRLGAALAAAERRLPLDQSVMDFIAARSPDLIVVTPLIELGSRQVDYVRAARALGIPSALAVASWDNLTNKGRIREVPDLTVVWNEHQREEAMRLHDVPAQRVRALGAHSYDHWFGRAPSRLREAFCREVGLDPQRPYLLYTCSSPFIASDEVTFVRAWLARLRSAHDPALRDVGVLVRPHPTNAHIWAGEEDVGEPGRVAVWPPAGAVPTSPQHKADYFDSLHHAHAVVGINTSALIESAIAGRPVFTVAAEEFRETQDGTLHFAYLRAERGGPVAVAGDFDEHLAQLAHALSGPPEATASSRAFVERFLRPAGIDRPAAPLVAGALEALAQTGQGAPPSGGAGSGRPAPSAATVLRPAVAARFAIKRARAKSTRRPSRTAGDSRGRGLRILFVLDHAGMLIHFDETVRALAVAGHRVHLLMGREKTTYATGALEGTDGRVVVDERRPPQRTGAWAPPVRTLRAFIDYLLYLQPAMLPAMAARAHCANNPALPGWVVRMSAGRVFTPRRHRVLRRALVALEAAAPGDRATEGAVARTQPDVVLATPVVQRNPWQTDYVHAARALGLRSMVCVGSWDNLSSKGTFRALPDAITVWNETQRREATQLHGVPGERIAVTGAQPFDRWFGRAPSMSHQQFCAMLGLPTDRPFLLFVGSTRQRRSHEAEPMFVRRWLTALRASDDPALRDAPVLVRPHPTNARSWKGADLSDLGDVVVWDHSGRIPVLADERSVYFDALHHCSAVVGINTSAMVEAAIVGRVVHTVLLPEWHDMQETLVHFTYLLRGRGGFLAESRSFDEHVAALASDLHDPAAQLECQGRFVERFIRPQGVDEPSLPRLVQAIVDLGRAPRPAPAPLAPWRWALRSLAFTLGWLGYLSTTPDRGRERVRRLGRVRRRTRHAAGAVYYTVVRRDTPTTNGQPTTSGFNPKSSHRP
jgi:hypothetical protein